MHHIAAALHTLGVSLTSDARTKPLRPEGGSRSVEATLWGFTIIALVAIAVLGVRALVTNDA